MMWKAQKDEIVSLETIDLRDFGLGPRKQVDDTPYGGGAGMVMTCQPIMDGIESIKKTNDGPVIFMGPKGRPFTQSVAKELSLLTGFTLLCGHYEGIDERIYSVIDDEISLGDFVLTGGEMAALPIIDSVIRLLPGALGSAESTLEESFSEGSLEYPHYTIPADYKGLRVPDVLLSGHHENIRQWRRFMSLEATKQKRQDLFKNIQLTKADLKIIQRMKKLYPTDIEED